MANPCDIRVLKMPVEAKNVTTIEYEGPRPESPHGGLWLGYKNGSIVMFNRAQPDKDVFSLRCKIDGSSNLPVRDIMALMQPQCMVCHWCGPTQGPVEAIFRSGSRVRLFENAKLVGVSKNPTKTVFGVVAYDEIKDTSSVCLKRFSAEKVTDILEFDVPGCVRAVGVTNTQVVYYLDGCYWAFRAKDRISIQLMNDPVDFPFVCAMHDDRCLVCYKQFLLITGAAGQMTIKLSPFYGSPICIFATEPAVYIAYADVLDRVRIGKSRADQPQRLNVAGCRTMTAVNNELVVMTYTEPLIVGPIPAPGTMVDMFITNEKARVREVLGLLERNAASDLAFSMFKLMWKDGRKNEAFDLISGTLIVGHVPDIIALVPIIMQVKAPPKIGDLVPMGPTDISLLPQLSTFLKFTREEYLHHIDDMELLETMSLIDTSLAQILAVESRTRELAVLLEAGNVNAFILKEFCQVHSNSLGLGPGYAVLLTYLEQVEEAMTLWMKLEELKLQAGKENPLFIQEASITLRKLDDSSKLPLYLDWLFKHDPAAPQCVMEALLSPRHDPDIVEQWLQSKNLLAEKMKYDCYKVFHPGGETIANRALITLLDILKDIDSPSFDRSRIKFTKASTLAANIIIHEAKKEIEGIVIQILQLLGSVIDDEKALSHTQSKKVRLSVYQAKGRYEDGLQLLRNNGEFALDEVAEFCRGSVDPAKAYAAFLNMLDRNSLLTKYSEFIENNLMWINPVDIIKLIPPGTQIKAALQLVKASFGMLQYRKTTLERQIAMTQSMLVHSKAQMAVHQANSCTIGANAVCATCGRNISLDSRCFTPPGRPNELYHQQCKPGR